MLIPLDCIIIVYKVLYKKCNKGSIMPISRLEYLRNCTQEEREDEGTEDEYLELEAKDQANKASPLKCRYVSVWDGHELKSKALLDLNTGVVDVTGKTYTISNDANLDREFIIVKIDGIDTEFSVTQCELDDMDDLRVIIASTIKSPGLENKSKLRL